MPAAARYTFLRKLDQPINESSVRSLNKAYLVEQTRKRRAEKDSTVATLPKMRGRLTLLGANLDRKVQVYLRKIREVVVNKVFVAAATGILLKYGHTKLAEYGGPVLLNNHWARLLLDRMGFVQRKATTATSKYTEANFKEMKANFRQDVVSTVVMEDIPPELIMNWDQTEIKMVPCTQ